MVLLAHVTSLPPLSSSPWAIVILILVVVPFILWLWQDVLYRHLLSPFSSFPYAPGHFPLIGHIPRVMAESWGGPMVEWHRTAKKHQSGFYRIFLGPYEWLIPSTGAAIAAVVSRPFDFVVEAGMFELALPESLLTCKNQAHHKVSFDV